MDSHSHPLTVPPRAPGAPRLPGAGTEATQRTHQHTPRLSDARQRLRLAQDSYRAALIAPHRPQDVPDLRGK